VSQGYINAVDCVGAGVTCTRSGIVGTFTIPGGGAATAGGSQSNIQYNDATTLAGDISFNWNASANMLGISRDASQSGYALAISGDLASQGVLANISHDGTAHFQAIQLNNPLSSDQGGTSFSTYSKGDLITSPGTTLSKLGVGTNGQVLSADSSATNGIKWAEPTPISAKGDIMTWISSPTRLPVGTDGTVLSADSSTATGLKWVSPPVGGGSGDITDVGDCATGACFTGTTGGKLTFTEVSAPTAPAANDAEVYLADAFGKERLYFQGSDGNEFALFRDNVFIARNTGSNLPKGRLVYINGQLGNSRPTIALANSNAESTMPAVGMTYEAINTDSDGYVMSYGLISGISTDAGSAGDRVFVSEVSGNITATRPSIPSFTQPVGVIITSHSSNGKLFLAVPPIQRFGLLNNSSIPFGNAQGLIDQDLSLKWSNSLNTLYISRDLGQSGYAIAISGDLASQGTLANISHDGTAYFKAIQVTNPLSADQGGTSFSTYTKGDIITSPGSTLAKLGVGTNGQVLSADSSAANGIKWAEPTPISAKGDLMTWISSPTRLPVGANGTVLSADSSTATGLAWVAPPSGGGSGEANTTSNSGTGNRLALSKSGVDLPFRTLTSGDNVSMVTNANDVSISVVTIPSEDIVGIIAIDKGGTGASSFTDGGILIGKGTSPLANTGLLGKGTLVVGDGVTDPTTLTVGTNGQILSADSGATSGLKWVNPSPLTTKGDIITYTTGPDRFAVGTDGTVLSADSSTPSGLKWVAPPPSGSGNPGGSNANIQFSDAGSFGGDISFNWNKSTNTLGISRDASQTGYAVVISGDLASQGVLANVSHDGSGYFQSMQLANYFNSNSTKTTWTGVSSIDVAGIQWTGLIAYVSTDSAVDSNNKAVTASCAAGFQVVGGGCETTDLTDLHLGNSNPLANRTGWRCHAREGDAIAGNWQVTAQAICVKSA